MFSSKSIALSKKIFIIVYVNLKSPPPFFFFLLDYIQVNSNKGKKNDKIITKNLIYRMYTFINN
jgi:hypothetical protein